MLLLSGVASQMPVSIFAPQFEKVCQPINAADVACAIKTKLTDKPSSCERNLTDNLPKKRIEKRTQSHSTRNSIDSGRGIPNSPIVEKPIEVML